MAENEDADDLAITFRSAGKPVRMSSVTKWRRAITLGDLTRETLVEVEAGGRSQGVSPAGAVPALKRLFDEISPRAEADDAALAVQPAPDEPIPPPLATQAVATRTPQPSPPPPPPVSPPSPGPAAVVPPVEKKKSGPGGCLITLGIVLVVAFVAVKSCSHRHPVAPFAEAQTVYVTRQVNLRPEPSSGNTPTGVLDRGAALTGVWNDADKTWFRVTIGDHQGGYVWGMDLAVGARPDLAAAVDAARTTQRAVTEYREPDTSASSEREVAAGETLVVAGRLASGWWEVTNKGRIASTVAGVGYVPPETFDALR